MEMNSAQPDEAGQGPDARLTWADVTILKAVQEINGREGYDPDAEEVPPATTARISEATYLEENEITYRFNKVGFDDDLGYLEIHGSRMLENGVRSERSAELTDAGRRALDRVLAGGTAAAAPEHEDRLAELEDELADLRRRYAELREYTSQVQRRDVGSWDPDRVDEMEDTRELTVALTRVFGQVFGIDVRPFLGDDPPPDAVVEALREGVREQLQGTVDAESG